MAKSELRRLSASVILSACQPTF